MSGSTQVVVHADATVLAAACAARLITRLADAQASRGTAAVVLTGGGVGIAALRAVRDSPARDAIDWQRLDVWWGDERFVAAGDPQRNDRQAHEALLDAVPLDPRRVHPMPARPSDTSTQSQKFTPEAAAQRYASELATHSMQNGDIGEPLPRFDVLMLGMGPEGHVASIFPESPAARATGSVTAVRNCPKPPPTRISLTFPAIQSADEVWLLAAGGTKARAIGLALAGANPTQLPAAGAHGASRTLWLLDQAAAADIPATVRTPY